jgi:predicted HNH restriction endonuclease
MSTAMEVKTIPEMDREELLDDLITLCNECHELFHSNSKLARAPK